MSENSSVELKFMFIINQLLIMLLVYCILYEIIIIIRSFI